MNEIQKAFISNIPGPIADELLMRVVSKAMSGKLKEKRLPGWQNHKFPDKELKKELMEHVRKGNMVDVLNYAAMLYVRGELWNELEGDKKEEDENKSA